MATKASDQSRVLAAPNPNVEGEKKRTRLNPARRKAAKAKAEADVQQETQAATPAVSGNEKPQLQPKKSIAKPAENETSKLNSKPIPTKLPPPSLPRHNTAPVPTTTSSKTTITPRKHTLPRTTTTPPPTSNPNPNPNLPPPALLKNPALVTGGLVGCAAGAALLLSTGLWTSVSGPETALLAAKATKLSLDNLADDLIAHLRAGTYSTDEALDVLRRATLAYASTVPGGAGVVEKVFREVGIVRVQRGGEVDGLVSEVGREVAGVVVGGRGASEREVREVVGAVVARLAGFVGRATGDVVRRNPGWSPVREGAVRALSAPQSAMGRREPTVRVDMVVRQKGG